MHTSYDTKCTHSWRLVSKLPAGVPMKWCENIAPTIQAEENARMVVNTYRPHVRGQTVKRGSCTFLPVSWRTHSSCSRGTPEKRPMGRPSGVNSLLESRLENPKSQTVRGSIRCKFSTRICTCTTLKYGRGTRVLRRATHGFPSAANVRVVPTQGPGRYQEIPINNQR